MEGEGSVSKLPLLLLFHSSAFRSSVFRRRLVIPSSRDCQGFVYGPTPSGQDFNSKQIHRASNTLAAAIQDVSVDHRRAHVFVTEKFLNSSYIVPVFQQVRGEAVTERMAATGLWDAGFCEWHP
jgi:hypothetical protein